MILRHTFFCSRTIARRSQHPIAPIHTSARLAQTPSATEQSPKPASQAPISSAELESLLSTPTWSVESLLPPSKQAPDAPAVTPQQLHHLLRLSALPLPASQQEEEKMLLTLSEQLHFVGKIQEVDATGVKPLRAIRDETPAAEQEQTITLETLKDALAKEKVIGKHYKRIQRDTTPVDASNVESWDVLGSAGRKQGKYFVVESERPQE